MKSIYSQQVLQRILDHWGVGQIEDGTYFEKVGRGIWRQYLETSQGDFELFSYPVESREYAEKKLRDYFTSRRVQQISKLVHSFDRYHVLIQLVKKHQISLKQAEKDLHLILTTSIERGFRVYGTIMQLHLNTGATLVTYAHWKITDQSTQPMTTLADTDIHSRDQLDSMLEISILNKPKIDSYEFKDDWLTLQLSNQKSLHFSQTASFAALKISIPERKNDLHIYSENRIFYYRDLL